MGTKAKIVPMENGMYTVKVKYHWWQRYRTLTKSQEIYCPPWSFETPRLYTLEGAKVMVAFLTTDVNEKS
jgi:hypothetical protein